MRILFAVIVSALFACASGPRLTTPTPSNPTVACIAPTLIQQTTAQGKLLPERVLIIGEYESDSDQWMIIRGVYSSKDCVDVWDRKRCPWLPMAKGVIRTTDCGAETNAMREMGVGR